MCGKQKIEWKTVTSNYVVDSSVWINYFGAKISVHEREIIETGTISISVIAFAEVADKLERSGLLNNEFLEFMQVRSRVVPLTFEICKKAAHLKNQLRISKPKFGLADAIHLATSQQEHAILLTSDKDFEGIDNTKIV